MHYSVFHLLTPMKIYLESNLERSISLASAVGIQLLRFLGVLLRDHWWKLPS